MPNADNIVSSGGGCTKDADGNLVLIKDQDGDSAAITSILNSKELKVPVGIIIGEYICPVCIKW